jgi:hypothetical protein
MNGFFINTADTAAVAIIDAVIHAQRLSDNKVAAHYVDVRPLQWGVIQAHGKPCGNIQL